MSPARLPKFGDAGLTGLRYRRLTARRKGAAEVTTPTLSRNIVISVVLALAAAVALVLYTNHVQDSAKSSGDAVRVVVVTRDIKAGTAVSSAAADGDLAYRTVRRSDLVPDHGDVRRALHAHVVVGRDFDDDGPGRVRERDLVKMQRDPGIGRKYEPAAQARALGRSDVEPIPDDYAGLRIQMTEVLQ